ncbi:MAG: hypothetical protein MR707_08470 [Galactobacillus timonensis]|uniref:hypothetical protein n=1 Tax=Galactobacillus timonensis TaxID=2041840 RepID=UPI0023F476D0|nr:hypothetical protein [Galactobacillus timonensis]MCI6068240.1 hypothetical protein [Galactobacillus timonensis]MCI6755252.1 hypothetical protein [Galactobacillus timonensis]
MKVTWPDDWEEMSNVGKTCWILKNYIDMDREDQDGYAVLKDSTPEEVKTVYNKMVNEEKENLKNGLIVD